MRKSRLHLLQLIEKKCVSDKLLRVAGYLNASIFLCHSSVTLAVCPSLTEDFINVIFLIFLKNELSLRRAMIR